MKLIGQARRFWTHLECSLERADKKPITQWVEMKERLREQYLPLAYRERLLAQWQSLRQGFIPVTEYIAKFNEHMMRCNVADRAPFP